MAITTTFSVPALPYEADALSPQISAESIHYHYGKHLKGYVDNLNRLIAGTKFERMTLEEIIRNSEGATFNNAAQMWNHIFFFDTLSPTPKMQPTGVLAEAIERDFGGMTNFRREFDAAALSLFGSGWVWLAADCYNRLMILPTHNAATPLSNNMVPLLTVDVWEHAYYIDYRNRRSDYIEAVWDRLDWRKAEERFR